MAAADVTGKGITAAADVTGKGITAGAQATAQGTKTAVGTTITGVVKTGKAINDAANAEILPEEMFPSMPHSPDNRTVDDTIAGTVDALSRPVAALGTLAHSQIVLPAGLRSAHIPTTSNDSDIDVQAVPGIKPRMAQELDPLVAMVVEAKGMDQAKCYVRTPRTHSCAQALACAHVRTCTRTYSRTQAHASVRAEGSHENNCCGATTILVDARRR